MTECECCGRCFSRPWRGHGIYECPRCGYNAHPTSKSPRVAQIPLDKVVAFYHDGWRFPFDAEAEDLECVFPDGAVLLLVLP